MRFVRRQRQRLLALCFGLLFVVVVWFGLVRPSAEQGAILLPGFGVESPGTQSYYALGLTEWMIVEKRSWPKVAGGSGPLMVERHLRPNPDGMVQAVIMLLAMGLLTPIAYRRLMHSLRARGHCDECGYDLTARISSYCPECGGVVRS